MIRDFSEASREKLHALVDEVESEKWCDFTDWFGDRWMDFQSWIGQLNIKNYINNVNEYHKKVIDKNNTTKKKIDEIFENVHQEDNTHSQVIASDLEILEAYRKYLAELIGIISPENGAFNAAIIHVKFFILYPQLQKYLKRIGSPAYIYEDGIHYGGRQHGAYNRWIHGDTREISLIIHQYYPGYTNEQIEDLLDEMNSEGCNYMALVNTVFGEYVGREEEFEKMFGYPMYDENGYPNWDLVMVDFYCSQGEIDGKTGGLDKTTSEQRWEAFLKEKGVKVDVVNIDVTVDNFDEKSKRGEIIVGFSPLRMRDATGKLVDTRNGGHAVVITGVVTVNGKKMYKVSSWGMAFYIDPDDYKGNMRIEYQQVRY